MTDAGGPDIGLPAANRIESDQSAPLIIPAGYPGDFHDQVEREHLDDLRNAGNTCISEVNLTFDDITARLDILCTNRFDVLSGIEIKTGLNPDYTEEQKIVYPHAILGFGVTSPDSKISDLGLAPGVPLPPITLYVLYAPGPGLPYVPYLIGPKR